MIATFCPSKLPTFSVSTQSIPIKNANTLNTCPSKYSNEIQKLSKKYKIYKHFICNENIEGNVFTLFINKLNTIFIDSIVYITKYLY